MARKHYTLEYREQIVALVKSGRSITSVAKEFGLADQTVPNWLREAREGPLGLRERERAFHRADARLQEERNILAKATARVANKTTKALRRSSSS